MHHIKSCLGDIFLPRHKIRSLITTLININITSMFLIGQQTKGLFTWYQNDFHSVMSSFHLLIFLYIRLSDTKTMFHASPYRSFQKEFIPASSLNKIFAIWYEISFWYHETGNELCSGLKIPNCLVLSLVVFVYLMWDENHTFKWEHLRLSHSILSCECSMNFTLGQNSFWNESHYGII